jgi:hypothetical protein
MIDTNGSVLVHTKYLYMYCLIIIYKLVSASTLELRAFAVSHLLANPGCEHTLKWNEPCSRSSLCILVRLSCTNQSSGHERCSMTNVPDLRIMFYATCFTLVRLNWSNQSLGQERCVLTGVPDISLTMINDVPKMTCLITCSFIVVIWNK